MEDLKDNLKGFLRKRTITRDIVQGAIVGFVLVLITAILLIDREFGVTQTTVNGWSIITKCGVPGDNILLQAACAEILPAVNLPQEEAYWISPSYPAQAKGQILSGQHDYRLYFPPGGLPPNNATWSLTLTDPQAHFVNNSINRYSVGPESGLVQNANGSVSIYIQNIPPAGNESNWLPAPAGAFKLWLRVYAPGQAILNGSYHVPPVAEVK